MTAGPTGPRRVVLRDAEVRAIDSGRFVRVSLGTPIRFGDAGATRSALVGRVNERVVAWANLCQHNPVPLDLPDIPDPDAAGVTPAPMADDGVHLMCHSHGALYRLDDGECVLGPCFGQKLFPLVVTEEAGTVALVLE